MGFSSGLGFLNGVHEARHNGTSTFMAKVQVLRGSCSDPDYVTFECRVANPEAQRILAELKPALDAQQEVLVGFTVSEPVPRPCGGSGDGPENPATVTTELLRVGLVKVRSRQSGNRVIRDGVPP